MPNIVGGCLCGSVSYESEAEPTLTAVCHCRHCQKQTSSAFSMFIVLPKGSLRIEGEPLAAFEDVGESGLPVFRKFCPKCGSAIVGEHRPYHSRLRGKPTAGRLSRQGGGTALRGSRTSVAQQPQLLRTPYGRSS